MDGFRNGWDSRSSNIRSWFCTWRDPLSLVNATLRSISHHIAPHHITSHHITSHPISSHHITSHHITSHPIHHHITPDRPSIWRPNCCAETPCPRPSVSFSERERQAMTTRMRVRQTPETLRTTTSFNTRCASVHVCHVDTLTI